MTLLLTVLLCAFVAAANGAINPHIIGGEKSDPTQHPYGCSLQSRSGSRWYHICGAVIWNEKHIVTAAHCVEWGGEFRVRCGLHKQNDNHDIPQTIGVTKVEIHEHYGQGTGTIPNDIAVLKLASSLTYTSIARGFRFANPGDGDFAGQTCTLSGWGIKDDGSLANTLKRVDMMTLSNVDCGGDWPGSINDGHVCVKEAGKSSCNGDSGGPMRCGNVIVGLTSWGIGGCSPHKASVNTRVSFFYDWLVGKAGANVYWS